ncbi:MAG: outer membrane lipoprotein carrier protein LolA [Bacteroides sp.]
MNRRIIIALAAIGLLSLTVQGQDDNGVLKQFADRMQQLDCYTADFVLRVENQQNGMKDEYNGALEARRNGYWISTLGMEVYCDGKSRWQYLPGQEELTITQVDSASTSPLDNPMSIFQGYAERFKVRYMGKVEGAGEKGESCHKVVLVPRDLSMPFSQIFLLFTVDSLKPRSIDYRGKDGVNYQISIRNFRVDGPARKSFAFPQSRINKQMKVVDLR